jgi:ubiquitin-protein ligase
MHYLLSAAIMKGVGNPYLFLGESPGRRNFIRYLDPVGGRGAATEGNYDDLARLVRDEDIDPLLDQLEGDRRDQAIQICFDASTSMDTKLDGYRTRGKTALSRCSIAKNYLRAFRDRSYAYRLVSAYGLYSFASTVTPKCALTYTMDRFEAALNEIAPKGSTALYDAIDAAASDLIAYFNPPDGSVRPPAKRRIIVISDGEDSEWGKNAAARTDPVRLTQRLIQNKIVVDAVLVSTVDENEPLWAICDLTGGLAFRSKTEDEGLRLFEQEAFLNLTIRRQKAAYAAPLTEAVFNAKIREFDKTKPPYAVEAGNHAVTEANQQFPLASLLYGIRQAMKCEPPAPEGLLQEDNVGQRRYARVLREVKYIKTHLPPGSPDYEVWVNYERIDRIRAFFTGAPGSPFAGKWWSVYITFPTQYPGSPPVFRFVNIPYHPNVSAEGRVLFASLDRAYTPEKTIWDLIVATRELLGNPEAADALNQEIGREFQTSRREYDRKARESADREGAPSTDWPYTHGRRYTDADSAAIAGAEAQRELDDGLANQLSLTRTTPTPIMLAPDDTDGFYD